MQLRKFTWLLALLICSPAQAQVELVTVVEAVELSPVHMILPGSTNGMMTYRGCSDDCDKDYKRARLTEATSFVVDGDSVKFEEFRLVYGQIRNSEDAYALVSVDLELGIVTNITLKR